MQIKANSSSYFAPYYVFNMEYFMFRFLFNLIIFI